MATIGAAVDVSGAAFGRELLEHLVLDFRQMREFAAQPWVFVRGEGVRLQDDTGKWYLDGLSGVFVTSLGYGNQRVVEAAVEQLRTLHFAPPLHGTNPPALQLAERLRRLAPPAMWGADGAGGVAVKLLSGGSEATEAALKLARQYHQQAGHPRKYKVIARYGAYHGATMGALSAGGGWERKSVFEPLVPGFLHHHPPHVLRDLTAGLLDDVASAIASARLVERMIEAEDPETVAAVIVEPISVSSAGFVAPPAAYLQVLREACDRHHVLLIYDEVITGFGRLGAWFGAQHFGVTPDLLCCGKGMAGGYAPLAAVLISARVWEAFLGAPGERKEFHHGHTFGANPVSAAVGVATIDELEALGAVENARRQGAVLRTRLEALRDRFPTLIADVRGAGLLQGLEFNLAPFQDSQDGALGRDGRTASPGRHFEALARERGLIARCGHDFVVFAPPLIIGDADLEEMLGIAAGCLEALADSLATVPAASTP
ncbi:MAG TPA: aspartate aminotransferase family protein [Chloroflexota bacterium]|nr:aspartate aminotransferase family protein [Chloroflexota bacterium]